MRIAIVNDVRLIGEALRRHVMQEHEVIWVAHGGAQALQFCLENRPDLILMDLVMPQMDGVQTTRLIMQSAPCAILLVTASPEHSTDLVFRALGAGALDVTAIPVGDAVPAGQSVLLKKIRTLGRLIGADTHPGSPAPLQADNGWQQAGGQAQVLVAIGTSTGGPVALARLLHIWTPPAHCALVIVQHIDRAFTDSLAQWLAAQAGFAVNVVASGDAVTGGKIFMAKTDDHLLLDEHQRLRYSAEPSDYAYRPSVDVFFHAVARHWPRKAIGVLLTGMGRDGAQGLLAMRQAGQLTIAQDQASSAVYGMPHAAAQLQAAQHILSLPAIGQTLMEHTGSQTQP